MESSIAVFLMRQLACELLPTASAMRSSSGRFAVFALLLNAQAVLLNVLIDVA